jgi:hypothetical protein
MHSPTKKEKRSKKERKAATTTELHFSVNFGLVSTYKGWRGAANTGTTAKPAEAQLAAASLPVALARGQVEIRIPLRSA